MNQYSKYYQSIEFLESLTNLVGQDYFSKIEAQTVYFDRMKFFLNLLGNPHLYPKYIHITGTSGKGSTATMLQYILKENGLKTGCYKSPYLSEFTERFQVNNKFIHHKTVVQIIDKFKTVIEQYLSTSPYSMLSYGELVMCMAFEYFKQEKCDWVILEAGCGGLCDYSNVIPPSEISIITNIGHDHLKLLGPSLSDVARAKSGIIKKGSYFLTTETKSRYLKIFKTQCKKVKALYNHLPFSYTINSNNTFTYNDENYQVGLLGEHQIQNALLAIQAAKHIKIPLKIINKGLQKVKFAGRLELMQQKPLVILDTAHNLEKVTSTIKTIKEIKQKYKTKKMWLIFGFSSGKDITPILNLLVTEFDNFLLSRHTNTFRKSVLPKSILDYLKKHKPKSYRHFYLNAQEALKYALKNAHSQDLILISGSIYMAGNIREHWFSKETILKNRSNFK